MCPVAKALEGTSSAVQEVAGLILEDEEGYSVELCQDFLNAEGNWSVEDEEVRLHREHACDCKDGNV